MEAPIVHGRDLHVPRHGVLNANGTFDVNCCDDSGAYDTEAYAS